VKPGGTEAEHFISGIDLMPTILDALGLEPPEGMDGRSFLPLLRGKKQDGRTLVFTQFHQTAGRNRYPMRCVQNARFGYIFNAWSDGRRIFRNESQSGRSMKAMRAAAASSEDIRARVDLFLLRTVEEFYDFANDPDALKNLVGDPKVKKDLDALRSELEGWMVRTKDPALDAFRHRDDPAALARFMAEEDARARPGGQRTKKKRKQQT
jgi:N-sulfoglucosamine sulfohydrolase